jgi:hypothetical protein
VTDRIEGGHPSEGYSWVVRSLVKTKRGFVSVTANKKLLVMTYLLLKSQKNAVEPYIVLYVTLHGESSSLVCAKHTRKVTTAESVLIVNDYVND